MRSRHAVEKLERRLLLASVLDPTLGVFELADPDMVGSGDLAIDSFNDVGSFAPLSACIRTFWPRPLLTSWHGSPGPCWHKSAAMKRASRSQQPDMNTLGFTKGMAVAPTSRGWPKLIPTL
jgi:hypothetical protein